MQREFYLPTDYPNEPRLRDLPRTPGNWLRLPLLALIRLYQNTLSRGLPEGTCRFYPSCSHYSYQAIYTHGALKGTGMAVWRVLRCNPLTQGVSIPSHRSHPSHMKRLALLSLIGLGALLLSACGTPMNISWPGLAADAENAYLANGNLVYAVRLNDGLKLWQYPEKSAGQVFHSNPVVTPDGQVLVGSAGADNGIVSLDPGTGRENWAAPLVAKNHWIASPLVVGETIYAADSGGTLYAAELATGHILWSLPVNDSLWSAPSSNGKLVFLASLDHTLYAVDPQRRSVAWKTELGGSAAGSATVSSDGNTVYVGSFGKKVYAIEAASGAIQWAAEMQDWVWGAPVQDGDSLYAADIGGHIYSLGTPHGKNAWPDLRPDGPITGSPLVLGDGMLVATESGTVFAFDRSGAKRWDLSLGGQIYTTPVAAGDVIVIAPMKAEFLLRAVSQDGKLLPWEFTGK